MSLDSINNQLLPLFYEVKPLSLSSCWSKLYLSQVIRENGIRFHEELRLSEDTLFNLDYLACIEQVVVSNLPVTFYRTNAASVTKVFHAEHLDNRLRFFDILKEREYEDAPVHIAALLFFEICKIERFTKGRERKLLEKKIRNYLSENAQMLRRVRKLSLSAGRWQKYAYRAAAICFANRAYWIGFMLLRVYAAVTQGEINDLTANQ